MEFSTIYWLPSRRYSLGNNIASKIDILQSFEFAVWFYIKFMQIFGCSVHIVCSDFSTTFIYWSSGALFSVVPKPLTVGKFVWLWRMYISTLVIVYPV